MKLLLFNIILLLSFEAFGQLPTVVTNTVAEDHQVSLIYKTFKGQYDFMIAYVEESFWWSDRKDYNILALKDDNWYCLTLSSRLKKNNSFTKPTIGTRRIDSKKVESLIGQLNDISFWSLDNDSLNIMEVTFNDSTSIIYTISDGANYKFEILTNDDFRIIEAYEPDYFLEIIPEVSSRQTFIIGRDLFRTLIKNNQQPTTE